MRGRGIRRRTWREKKRETNAKAGAVVGGGRADVKRFKRIFNVVNELK